MNITLQGGEWKKMFTNRVDVWMFNHITFGLIHWLPSSLTPRSYSHRQPKETQQADVEISSRSKKFSHPLFGWSFIVGKNISGASHFTAALLMSPSLLHERISFWDFSSFFTESHDNKHRRRHLCWSDTSEGCFSSEVSELKRSHWLCSESLPLKKSEHGLKGSKTKDPN